MSQLKIVFEQLLEMLSQIEDLLKQIQQITENQRNILLQEESEDVGLEMIEEMAKYKEQLTTEIEEVEKRFQDVYTKIKEYLAETEYAKPIKTYVESILSLKEIIVKLEQHNVNLLREKLKTHTKPVHIMPKANHVAAAYNVQNAYRTEE